VQCPIAVAVWAWFARVWSQLQQIGRAHV
jgi:hypothetical protein